MEDRRRPNYAAVFEAALVGREFADIFEGDRARVFDALRAADLNNDSEALKALIDKQFPGVVNGEVPFIPSKENIGKLQTIFNDFINGELLNHPIFLEIDPSLKRDVAVALGNKLLFGGAFNDVRLESKNTDPIKLSNAKKFFADMSAILKVHNIPLEEAYISLIKDAQDILRERVTSGLTITLIGRDVNPISVVNAIDRQNFYANGLEKLVREDVALASEKTNRAMKYLGDEGHEIYNQIIASVLADSMKALYRLDTSPKQDNDPRQPHKNYLGRLDSIINENLKDKHSDVRDLYKKNYDNFIRKEMISRVKSADVKFKEDVKEKEESGFYGSWFDELKRSGEKEIRIKESQDRDSAKVSKEKEREGITSPKLSRSSSSVPRKDPDKREKRRSITIKPKTVLGLNTIFRDGDKGKEKEKKPSPPPSPRGPKGSSGS